MGVERVEVICPFYRYDDGSKRIVCEGLTSQTTISQSFRRKTQCERFMEHYCFRHCMDCEIFRLLIRVKYSDI